MIIRFIRKNNLTVHDVKKGIGADGVTYFEIDNIESVISYKKNHLPET